MRHNGWDSNEREKKKIVGKGENPGHKHFLFQEYFKSSFAKSHQNLGMYGTGIHVNFLTMSMMAL